MASVIPTCSTNSMGSKLSARVWLEVGYACEPRRAAPGHAAAQEWRVWVRGVAGADTAAFVRRVVFQLRPENKFPYPERVFEEPPYLVRKCGVAPTDVLISVFLKHTTQPELFRLQYGPLVVNPEKAKADSRCIFYDVKYPSEQLHIALMTTKLASANSDNKLILLPDRGEVHSLRPLQHKQVLRLKNSSNRVSSRRKEKLWTMQSGNKHREAIAYKLWENMKFPSSPLLREDELQHVTQMCSAQSLYTKSDKALQLPPLSDPLFRLPELPASLRGALADDEPDYVLQ